MHFFSAVSRRERRTQTLRYLTRGLAGAVLCSGLASHATTYYVANSGSDTNSGTSQAQPWKTIGKLNSAIVSMRPGDSILLHGGDTFRDDYVKCLNPVKATPATTLATNPPPCSGTATAPFTIGSYGAGSPVLDGADPLMLHWTKAGGTTWQAAITGPMPSKLYIDPGATQSAQLLPVPNAIGTFDPAATYQPYDAVTQGPMFFVRGPVAASAGQATNDLGVWVRVTNTLANNTSQSFPTGNTGPQNVAAIPGSWYGSGSTVLVNLKDGSDPNTHRFAGTRRPYGVLLTGANHVNVTGLTVARVLYSGIASIPFSNDNGTYLTGEYVHVEKNRIFNYGSVTLDNQPLQAHVSSSVGGVLIRPNGSYNPHLLRGILIAGNTIGMMDCYFGLRGQRGQSGIMAVGIDGGGPANNIVIENNFVSTVNAPGIIYSMENTYTSSKPPLLNNGGRVTGNELTNNQGNLFFTATAGGMEDHNRIHESYGEGVQSGGGSTSTPQQPQTHAFDLIYNLGASASAVGYNGFDCNGTLSGAYWLNNTVVNTYAATITLEGGCDSAHVHNNIFDQNELSFPDHQINKGYLMYYVSGSAHVQTDFSNNLWINGANPKPFHGTADAFDCNTFFGGWPDPGSQCTKEQVFRSVGAADFTVTPGSSAAHAGVKLGALP